LLVMIFTLSGRIWPLGRMVKDTVAAPCSRACRPSLGEAAPGQNSARRPEQTPRSSHCPRSSGPRSRRSPSFRRSHGCARRCRCGHRRFSRRDQSPPAIAAASRYVLPVTAPAIGPDQRADVSLAIRGPASGAIADVAAACSDQPADFRKSRSHLRRHVSR
jgi:hypothetical protein